MQKVMVLGCPGSGKSTFSRKLRDVTGLPLVYLDMLFHRADKSHVSREEFDAALAGVLAGECFILDGNYGRTAGARLAVCDTVFLFDLPVEVCLAGVRDRRGKPREDMPWIETEEDPVFTEYILGFAENELAPLRELLNGAEGKNIVVFHAREEADRYIEELRSHKV